MFVAAISLIVTIAGAVYSVYRRLCDKGVELRKFPEDVSSGFREVNCAERGPPMLGAYRGEDAIPKLSGVDSAFPCVCRPIIRDNIVCRTHDFGLCFGETMGGDSEKKVGGCFVGFGA